MRWVGGGRSVVDGDGDGTVRAELGRSPFRGERALGSFVPKREREGGELFSTKLLSTTDSGRGTCFARDSCSFSEVMTLTESRRSSVRTEDSRWALMKRVVWPH